MNDMPPDMAMMESHDMGINTAPRWTLYILRTESGWLYTGITTDLTRRLRQHQAGKGAKALRGKGELTLVYQCQTADRSQALKLEYRVKQLSKQQKQRLIENQPLSLIYLLP